MVPRWAFEMGIRRVEVCAELGAVWERQGGLCWFDQVSMLPACKWWAHQDSNLEPRDSRDPGISARRGLSLRPQLALVGRGTLLPVIKGTRALR
jgi:hypothetical protein